MSDGSYSVWRCSDCGHWVEVTTITRTHITKRRMPAEVAVVEMCRLLSAANAAAMFPHWDHYR